MKTLLSLLLRLLLQTGLALNKTGGVNIKPVGVFCRVQQEWSSMFSLLEYFSTRRISCTSFCLE